MRSGRCDSISGRFVLRGRLSGDNLKAAAALAEALAPASADHSGDLESYVHKHPSATNNRWPGAESGKIVSRLMAPHSAWSSRVHGTRFCNARDKKTNGFARCVTLRWKRGCPQFDISSLKLRDGCHEIAAAKHWIV